MNFLFRLPGSDVFITTDDPKCRYDVLCGHCEYPVAEDDPQCPRCQRLLEDCPVCRTRRHRKSLRRDPEPQTGAINCSVCGIKRVPFGEEGSLSIRGSFCTNLYGCPAGGLLLRTEEFAILPPDATLCPICRDEAFPPLDLKAFRYLISRCLFCSTSLGPIPSWNKGWSGREEALLNVDGLRVPEELNLEPCPLCGRDDRPVVGSKPELIQFPGIHEHEKLSEVSVVHYLRVVQLGRALILDKEESRSFRLTFDVWFDPLDTGKREERMSVARIGELLLVGTLRPEIRQVLKKRLEPFFAAWSKKLPSGVSYDVRFHKDIPGSESR
jgi:hypothetical protein